MSVSPLPEIKLSEERKARFEKCYSLFTSQISSNKDWVEESSPCDGVTMSSTAVEGMSLRRFKAVGIIPAPPSEVSRLLWEADVRMTWDKSYLGIQNLNRITGGESTDDMVTQRLLIKGILIISQRDFVCTHMRRTQSNGEAITISYAVPEEENVFPIDPQFTRGEVCEGTGWRVRPVKVLDGKEEKEHCELTYVIMTDLKGWVPAFVINGAMGQTFKAYYEGLKTKVNSSES
jgi:hypothetical protein